MERRFIYNVRKERKTVMAACARARMPTYISQPASSRQLSSDITEPKARAAVMQFESARLTLRIVARIRDAACVARAERAFQPRAFTSTRERKKERKERKGTAGILFSSTLEFLSKFLQSFVCIRCFSECEEIYDLELDLWKFYRRFG